MPQRERLNKKSELEDKQKLNKKPDQSIGLTKEAERGSTNKTNYSTQPSMDDHAYLLSSAQSDTQRIGIANDLQRHYGNRYVQRVVERSKSSKPPVPAKTTISSVSLMRNKDSTGISVNFSTIIKGPAKSQGKDEKSQGAEPSETREETTTLPGSHDSIKPGSITLDQQTVSGASALTGTNHGSYTPNITKNVSVKKHEGTFTNDWEVSASLTVKYTYSIQSLGKTDIPNENASEVTYDSWRDIVTDLRPMYGGVPRSPRFRYWCSDLSAQHEMYHILDCSTAFRTFAPLEAAWLEEQSTRTRTGAENLGFQALNQLVTKVFSYMGGNDPNSAQEIRAYGAGTSQYESRAEAIEDRALSEGWMEEGDYEEEEGEVEEEKDEVEDEEPAEEEEGEGESWWDEFWDDLWEDEEEQSEEEEEEESWWDSLWEDEEEEEEQTEEEGYGYEEGYYGEEEGYGNGEGSYNEEEGYIEEPYNQEEEYGYGEESYNEEEGYGEESGYEEEDYGYGYSEESYSEEEGWI